MKTRYRKIFALGGFGLFAAAAACSHDATLTGAVGAVPASVALAMGSGTSAVASPFGLLSDAGDSGRDGGHALGKVGRSDIDSLVVNVTKVEVHVEVPDTEDAADSAAEAKPGSARHEDEDRDDEHENDEKTWVSLDVTANGHIDLMRLPDSASGGITIATGTLAPGRYKHVRLFVTGPTIFFKNTIVTPTGDTLQAGVGYPVRIPSADSTGAAIKTDERFTVPAGGGSVQLFFDADDTIRHVVVTGDGTIILRPVIR